MSGNTPAAPAPALPLLSTLVLPAASPTSVLVLLVLPLSLLTFCKFQSLAAIVELNTRLTSSMTSSISRHLIFVVDIGIEGW